MKKTNYFNDCKTAEELKKAYYKAAKQLHPDNGGSEAAFKQMQADFSAMFDRLKNIHQAASGDTYERASAENAGEFMDIINILLTLAGVEVEMCGSWVWIGGDTIQHKDRLKEIGCRWSANKKMWYYQRDGVRRYHKKAWSIDQIRSTYGSTSYGHGAERDALPA